MIKQSVTTLAMLFACQAALADEFTPALQGYLDTNISQWATNPVILDALRAANAKTAEYDLVSINALDLAWQAEIGMSDTPTITPVLTNDAADFLRDQVDASNGVISEIFIMDQVGLNVAVSSVTSDMWQGDEEKFTQTYEVGAGATHIAEVEFDESTHSYLAQVSISISDPQTGDLLGAMTIGLNAEALF
ncbi:hypothetical protein [Yoonia sp.]|uniref:hypothetical protein n=1 Tax=Yoonia sp. TaxID=2212373 RepID=UPI0019E9364F|nr:hypothetical protein [Yoonia sp.]MBE0413466.1 hypothetical protein [Yoonia sp.]